MPPEEPQKEKATEKLKPEFNKCSLRFQENESQKAYDKLAIDRTRYATFFMQKVFFVFAFLQFLLSFMPLWKEEEVRIELPGRLQCPGSNFGYIYPLSRINVRLPCF